MSTSHFRLLVRICTDSSDPRTGNALGVLVLGEHPRRALAREGGHLDLIDDVLTDPANGRTPTARLDVLRQLLRTRHGASHVLGVWAHQTRAGGLRLCSSTHALPSHDDDSLLGVIYDTPRTRHATNTPLNQVGLVLVDEVADYDHWLNNEVYEWVIEQRADNSRSSGGAAVWRLVAGGVAFGYTDARIAGEDCWRDLVGPLYTETAPPGPTETPHPVGEVQLSLGYTRRFTRPLTNGELHGVVDIECCVVNANPITAPSSVPAPVLTRVITYTVCSDPANVTTTAVRSYTRHQDQPTPADPARWNTAARDVCAAFDPAELDWDGQPIA
jgi:hypothetical protein